MMTLNISVVFVPGVGHSLLTLSQCWSSHSVLLAGGGLQSSAQFLRANASPNSALLLHRHGNVHIQLGLRVLIPRNRSVEIPRNRRILLRAKFLEKSVNVALTKTMKTKSRSLGCQSGQILAIAILSSLIRYESLILSL